MLAEAEADAERTAREMRGIPESRRNGPTYKALEKQGREIDERYAGLEKVRNKLETEIAAATISDESIANFTAFSEDAIAGLSNPDYATKRRWLDYLNVKVEVDNKIATVSCMLPVESRDFDLRTASGMTSITLGVNNGDGGGNNARTSNRDASSDRLCREKSVQNDAYPGRALPAGPAPTR